MNDERWNQYFFWTLDESSNTWVQRERVLILDSDGTSVSTIISGSTSGSTSGTTF